MRRSRTSACTLVGLFVWLLGCTGYVRIDRDEIVGYDRVRVTTTTDRYELEQPRIDGDTIRGQGRLTAIPLNQVIDVEGWSGDRGAETLLGAGYLIAAVAVAATGCTVPQCVKVEID